MFVSPRGKKGNLQIQIYEVFSHLGGVNSTDKGRAQGETGLEVNFIAGSISF